MKIITKSILFLIISLLCITSFANRSLTSRPDVKQFINQVTKKYKYNASYVRWVLNKANYNPEVIRRMERPYEALPWGRYQKLFVNQTRVKEGISYWDRTNKLLAWEEREYAVPSNIIVAIIGIESKYGAEMGNFRVLDSLTTLAFYYPSRKKFFQKELASYILMTKVYQVGPDKLYGSYAGAMGQPQFMPSSYLHYAIDFHGKGRPNLYRDKADVIFSVGNYLRQNGWEPEQPIATRAQITGLSYKRIVQPASRKLREPKLTLRQLAKYGVYPAGHESYNPNLTANLIAFQSEHGTEYWITFHNFYVITTYNASDLYAMAVFQLGKQIQQAYEHSKQPKPEQ